MELCYLSHQREGRAFLPGEADAGAHTITLGQVWLQLGSPLEGGVLASSVVTAHLVTLVNWSLFPGRSWPGPHIVKSDTEGIWHLYTYSSEKPVRKGGTRCRLARSRSLKQLVSVRGPRFTTCVPLKHVDACVPGLSYPPDSHTCTSRHRCVENISSGVWRGETNLNVHQSGLDKHVKISQVGSRMWPHAGNQRRPCVSYAHKTCSRL